MTEYELTPGRNEVPEITAMRDPDTDELPKYSWPGLYPMYYFDAHLNALCPDCAAKNDEFTEPLIHPHVNWEDSNLYCDHCDAQIESAYGED
jgi:hypothetical protein